MRNALILLFIGVLQAHAIDTYSQKTRLSINFSDTELAKALDIIELESEFFFLYNEKLLDIDRKVTINEEDQLINVILNDLFQGTDIKYTIIDRKIILAPDYLTDPSQQQQSITGTVTDVNGNPLTGVTVQVKGTTLGVLTDASGKYAINIAQQNATLIFSFVGMATQEIPLNNRVLIDVVLKEEAVGLEEVVVVGYGTQKKINLTGSVARVDADELVKQIVTSAAQAIQGRVPGVEVIRNSGAPGAGATIRIRGLGTFGNSTPLVLIDGIEGDINLVSPQDIESVNILKDASAAAIYGVRAANGVVIVTTKTGKAGTSKISFNTSFGINQAIRIPRCLNATDFGIIQSEALINANISPYYSNEQIAGFGEGTNWVEAVLQTGFRQNHNLQFSGGTEKLRYSLMADMLDETGTVINSWYKRYNVRLNLDADVKDWLKIGLNSFVSHSKQHETPRQGYESPLLVYALQYTPTITPKVGGMEGTGGPSHTAPSGAEWWGMDPVTYSNLYAKNRNYYPKYTIASNFFADFKLMEGLNFRTTWGINKYFANNKVYSPSYTYYDSLGKEGGGSIIEQRLPQNRYLTITDDDDFNNTITNVLTFTKTFNNIHNLNILLGHNDQLYKKHSIDASVYNFPSDDIQVLSLGTERQTVAERATHWALRSFFGRLNYDYQGRYLAEFSLRRDASSKFAEKYRWGTFPSGSIGWRISKESFMSGFTWLDDMKLRASYGMLGGQDIGVITWNSSEAVINDFDLSKQPTGLYESFATMTMNASTSYPFNHTYSTGAAITTYANPNIKWEVAYMTNIALDMIILKGKINVTAEYFSKITKDLILAANLPATTGIFAGDRLGTSNQNVGEMKNTGFEYAVQYNERIGDFNFDIRYTGTHMKNEILKLQPGVKSYFLDANYASQHKIGEPYGAISGYNIIGVYQTQEEITERLATITERGAVQPGDYIYDDTNGDNKIDGNDVIAFGSPLPSYIFGLTANASYKGFDFNIHFQGDLGKKVSTMTRGRFNFTYAGYLYLNNYDYILERWTGPGSTNTMSRMVATSINGLSNSERVQDASYAKIRNIELGYTIPDKIIHKIGLQSLRVFCNAANLAYFTRYVGFEVERTGSFQRTDITPQSRTISFGANVQF